MSNLITAQEAADIYGVSRGLFNSARVGVGAPAAVVSERLRDPSTGHLAKMCVLYDAEQCKAWAAENDFWELAMDYRHRQRNGGTPRVRKASRRLNRTKPNGIRSVELIARDESVMLSQPLKDFLLGRFAPAPVRIAQDMKLIRARLNKPTTTRVSVNVGGEW